MRDEAYLRIKKEISRQDAKHAKERFLILLATLAALREKCSTRLPMPLMANALVWQESPNPRLHELFAKMLADESESPVWRDYCLQFLSECLKSSSDPEAIQSLLTRYAQGKDGLAGTAIVNVGLQEAAGRMKPNETFSQQLEAQLADPEVVLPTKLSILAMIGKRNDVRLLPLVRTYATNTTDSLRRCAIATLGQIGAPSDLPLIRAGLTDPNRAVQMAAEAALKAMDQRKEGMRSERRKA